MKLLYQCFLAAGVMALLKSSLQREDTGSRLCCCMKPVAPSLQKLMRDLSSQLEQQAWIAKTKLFYFI